MSRIALVTAVAAHALDEDMPPLLAALREADLQADVRAWDDPTVSWTRYDLVVLRSTWDYSTRLPEFLRWCEATSKTTRLLNPLSVVYWNTDKHYLGQLEAAGIAIVPSAFIEPGEEAYARIDAFLTAHPDAAQIVIKPAIGAGSRDARRHSRTAVTAMREHARHLLDTKRSVLMQPYFASVDAQGETALLYFDGAYSHSIRKGPLLRADEGSTRALFAAEHIQPREPGGDERALGDAVIAALPQLFDAGLVEAEFPLAYARVDLIRAADGAPRVLELELAEPSVFLDHGPGAAVRFVEALRMRLPGPASDQPPAPPADRRKPDRADRRIR